MAQTIKNVMLMGAGGLFGSHIFAALQAEPSFNLSILTRRCSKSAFPSHVKVHTVDDDYPIEQLVEAFTGQDALVSALPGRPSSVHLRMIDAAVRAGVKRFIPSEYGNNTSAVAAEIVPLYAEKAKVIEHLKSREGQGVGLTWTAIHAGQFLDWGLESGWLDYDLEKETAVIYDSGDKRWSTTNIDTASAAIVKVLLKPEETKNRPVYVASFTLSQRQLLEALEEASGTAWGVRTVNSEQELKRAIGMGSQDLSEGLKLRILVLLYAGGAETRADFEKDGPLDNELLGLPVENLAEVVGRVVKRKETA